MPRCDTSFPPANDELVSKAPCPKCGSSDANATYGDGHDRLFVEAVAYRYRTGTAWRDLPERFGDGVEVQRRFSRWVQSGVWERVFRHPCADADDAYAMIDSTIVRAHQHNAGAHKSRAGSSPRAPHPEPVEGPVMV